MTRAPQGQAAGRLNAEQTLRLVELIQAQTAAAREHTRVLGMPALDRAQREEAESKAAAAAEAARAELFAAVFREFGTDYTLDPEWRRAELARLEAEREARGE